MLLVVVGVSIVLILLIVSWVDVTKLTKLYIWNICNLEYVYYTSIKLLIYIYNPIQEKTAWVWLNM